MDDIKYLFHIMNLLFFVKGSSEARSINVTLDKCDTTIDLTPEGASVTFIYAGVDLGGRLTPCEFTMVNKDTEQIICVESGYWKYFDYDCIQSFKYNVNGRYSHKFYTCSDFPRGQPRCDKAETTYASFYSVHKKAMDVKLRVYSTKNTPTTTRRYTTYSWSSWSSYDDDTNDDSSNGFGTWKIVGVIISIILTIVICLCYVATKKRSSSGSESQNPTVLQYHSGNMQYSAAQTPDHLPSTGNQAYTQGSAGTQQYQGHQPQQPTGYQQVLQLNGYQMHPPVYEEVVGHNQHGTGFTEQQLPSAPSDEETNDHRRSASPNSDLPSVPPPPYPGI